MRPVIIQRSGGNNPRHSGERGVTMALVAVSIVAILAMAGLSIDIGTLYEASAEAQRAADAAALAAAKSLSLNGVTGDPNNKSGNWTAACNAATLVAQTIGGQNNVGGAPPSSVIVTFPPSAVDGSTCTAPSGAYGTNPMITVQVVQSNLPAYFSRIWGRSGSSVSATATAEVYNPSGSASYSASGNLIPVQPRCVKPFIVPNVDPGPTPGCSGAACKQFVNFDGTINNQGFSIVNGGVIGESFLISPDCSVGTGVLTCNSSLGTGFTQSPTVNVITGSSGKGSISVLQYVPGLVSGAPVGVPSCANGGGGSYGYYQQAVGGCDQTTAYQCGVQSPTTPVQVDFTENPALPTSDTSIATQCLIHGDNDANAGPDSLVTGTYPFQIVAGTGNPLGVSGNLVSNSDSIVTLPIYDNTATPLLPFSPVTQVPVNIIGFLQVFVNSVATGKPGTLNVTVLNVAGCGTGVPAGTPAIAGTSPVPVRLITPP